MKHQDFRHSGSGWRAAPAEGGVTCLIVPGLHGSGPGHWQTLWEQTRGDCVRAELGRWSDPCPDLWRDRLDRAVAAASGSVVLAAHSLGCFAVSHWAAQAAPALIVRVQGALLVAPPDIEAPEADPRLQRFAATPAPAPALPFRSIVVASIDDRYATPDRSRAIAAIWGAEFVDIGASGHINAASRLGAWPAGQALLEDLICRSAPRFNPR